MGVLQSVFSPIEALDKGGSSRLLLGQLCPDRHNSNQVLRRTHPATALQQLLSPTDAMAPKAMKKAMTSGAVISQVAEKTELKPKQVRAVFAELREVAYAEVAKTEKFAIPQLVTLKLKHKPARKAGTKMMFGKEVRVAAKPASKVVKAFPAKGLKDSI